MSATFDPESPRSRRAILAAGAAGAAGLIASAIGRPAITSAASGDQMVVGHLQEETTTTGLANLTNENTVFSAHSGAGFAMYGVSDSAVAVRGFGGDIGVHGFSTNGAGVRASSATGTALDAKSNSGFGVYSESDTGTGVFGVTDGSNGYGVRGENTGGGHGVLGSTNGPAAAGVVGSNLGSGVGVRGSSAAGTGVLAESTSGIALNVTGKTRFSRSGQKTITAGHAGIVVTMAGVRSSSWIVATLQTNRSGVYVRAAVPSTGKFTIYLNKTLTVSVDVGFLVLN